MPDNRNQLSTFDFNGIANIRVVEIDGAPWFVAADVCNVLGFKPHPSGGYSRHTQRFDSIEKMLLTTNQLGSIRGHSMGAISESGLDKFIMRSDKPEARSFQDWVTRVVLPAIAPRSSARWIVFPTSSSAARTVAISGRSPTPPSARPTRFCSFPVAWGRVDRRTNGSCSGHERAPVCRWFPKPRACVR